ncbi:FAD-dependent oxidoreductase [Breznakiella homolactica]|uniref:FAD-binding protein n=1 Tax=Breznakiella homolactica TaxID=2798577 RepID=A0A7T7XMI7_9SPIR|nr:FAD-dependent oxidoreductase [Breznakiella homolactica]QQO09026.1 FAD-dependent oxidoreductase [Breznakiella homolactica]
MKKHLSGRYVFLSLALIVPLILAGCSSQGSVRNATGSFEGTAEGHNGPVTVSVNLQSGEITGVRVLSHQETPGISDQALELIPQAIVRSQQVQVDAVSGATKTSRAIMGAVEEALSAAGISASDLRASRSAPAALAFTPGTYTGEAYGKWGEKSVEGFRFDSPRNIRPITVEVSVDASRILSVKIVSCDDTPGFIEPVADQIPADIVKHQSLAVDSVTGCTLTSRGVLNAAAAALEKAGADLVALNRSVPRSAEHRQYSADLIIVGAGGAGSAAALAATEAGVSVVIFEKTGKVGGMSALTTGFIGPESGIAKAAGSTVTVEGLFEEFMDYNQWTANSLVVKTVLETSGNTADWLKDHGYNLRLSPNGVTHDTGKGSAKLQNLYDNYILKNPRNTLLLQTAAQELIVENGKIAGVRGRHTDGRTVEARAKAVIIATGGFGGSKEMLRQYTGSDRYWLSGLAASSGEGLTMAISAGAKLSDEIYPHVTEFAANADVNFNDFYFKYLNYTGFLMLDTQGRRFMNEEYCITQPLAKGASAIRQAGSFYVIFDQNSYDIVKDKGFKGFFNEQTAQNLIRSSNWRSRALDPFGELMDIEMQRSMDANAAWKADSIAGLAAAIGFTDGVFENEIARYQRMISQKRDDDFSKNPLFLISLDKGPYYAVRMEPAIFGTLGGIRVDQYMRALDQQLTPIEGLYAAGQDAGGMYGYPYYETPGVTQGFAYNSGRIAGQQAAEFVR